MRPRAAAWSNQARSRFQREESGLAYVPCGLNAPACYAWSNPVKPSQTKSNQIKVGGRRARLGHYLADSQPTDA